MHELAIELMEELDEKYNMTNTLSLDEYLCEYSEDILTIDEINECKSILYTN
jgi:Leucine-rich repeat (LRR) protein